MRSITSSPAPRRTRWREVRDCPYTRWRLGTALGGSRKGLSPNGDCPYNRCHFAGSGAMGLEALSRGAARAVFVEDDREACRTIDRNLDKLRLGGARVVQQDALRALAAEAAAGRRYDLVLVDPPYEMFSSLQNGLSKYLPAVLAEDGLVVVETGPRGEPELPRLSKGTSRRYGSARLSPL